MKQTRKKYRGFALLLTLLLLMIGVIALAQVARQSASEAVNAIEARETLQRRWAVASCRETLLPRAMRLLDQVDELSLEENGVPIAGLKPEFLGTDRRVSCDLAGLNYEIVLTDEQAKYNPTIQGGLMLGDKPLVDKRYLTASIKTLAGYGRGESATREGGVFLRPLVEMDQYGQRVGENTQREDPKEAYHSYGQLFEGVSPKALLGQAHQPGVASQLTCWGNGKLNLRRAPDAVVKRVLSPVLGHEGVGQLLDARHKNPSLGANDWIQDLVGISPDQMALAQSLVTDRSRVQGLWVVAHGHRQSWYTFSAQVILSPDEVERAKVVPASTNSNERNMLLNTFDVMDSIRRYDFTW